MRVRQATTTDNTADDAGMAPRATEGDLVDAGYGGSAFEAAGAGFTLIPVRRWLTTQRDRTDCSVDHSHARQHRGNAEVRS